MGLSIPARLIEQGATGVDLICWMAMARGNATPTRANPGQLALADWIMIDPSRRAELVGGAAVLSELLVQRLIAGEILPTDLAAVAIEALTDDAVDAGLWDGAAVAIEGQALEIIEAEQAAPDMPFCHGTLGSIPPGRLFTVVRDYRTPGGGMILTGMGLALRLDSSSAASMHQALGEALR